MKKIVKGDIVYANLNSTKGNEIGGIIPVLVLQNNISNISSKTTIVAPISEKITKEDKQPTHILVEQFKDIRKGSYIMLEQMRVIDKSRIKGYIGMLNDDQMKKVKETIRFTFDI